ncbi:hypothetical protein M413DRAFT_290701 [Hebeloma cylindrosporum]|uniref:BTB domain-containing protein n=1 Tax=Hebeloma cylindrosporum TaxID=76867 RepID=A0A0C2Y5Y8_HEBCY|nr:hypothetical protein M413DRAFT_290701 [Hebeloma cylindrosporum h7]
MKTTTEEVVVRNHPIYWFEDGSLVLDVEVQRFKVHHSLLSRHSKFFSTLTLKDVDEESVSPRATLNHDLRQAGIRHVVLEPKRQVRARDVEALLGHFYHDVTLSEKSSFAHVTSILRITGPHQLDFPHLHRAACEIFVGMFSADPVRPFKHSSHLHEALPVATDFNLNSARKAILYHLVTTTDFDVSETVTVDPHNAVKSAQESPENNIPTSTMSLPTPTDTDAIALSGTDTTSQISKTLTDDAVSPTQVAEILEFTHTPKSVLSKKDAETCMSLMTRLISHFTPILFTPGATPHMGCTDVFADTWMSLVIQPAIEDDGVYKPIETLQRMKQIDWSSYGLCDSCVAEKKEEWTDEQRRVWELMDEWISEGV